LKISLYTDPAIFLIYNNALLKINTHDRKSS